MNKKRRFSYRILVIFYIALTSFVLSACKPNIEKLKSEGDINGLIEALTYGCPDDYVESDNYIKARKHWKNIYLRNDAREALVDLVGRDQVEPLLNLLANQDYECAHHNVVVLLGEIGDERAVDPLIDLLDHGADGSVIEALGKIGDQRAADAIIQSLVKTDSNTRLTAARVLDDLGDARAFDLLIDLLNDNDADIRLYAMYALKGIGDERALEPLVNLYRATKDVLYGVEAQIKDQTLAAVLELEYNEKSIEPLMNIMSSVSSSNDEQMIYQTVLEISLKLGAPMVEQFIKTYGYKVSDLPYASKDIAPLRDEFTDLVRSHYKEICEELQPANYRNNSVDAAEYMPTTSGLNKMILLNRDLTPHIWIESLSKEIAPLSVSETELIFVLDEAFTYKTGRICIWSNGPSTKEYYYDMQVQVFKALDGTILYEGEMKTPLLCGAESGEPFSFEDFWDWWISQLSEQEQAPDTGEILPENVSNK